MVYETFGLYSSQTENATTKRFLREHRGTHSKNDTDKDDKDRVNIERKEIQHTHTGREKRHSTRIQKETQHTHTGHEHPAAVG